MSISVQKAKVEAHIRALPPTVRRKVNAIYGSRKAFRHGSEHHGDKHPASAMTDDELVLAWVVNAKCGTPFRPMEPMFHLHPASGNDAQRCVNRGAKLVRKNGAPEYLKEALKEMAEMKEAAKKALKAEILKAKAKKAKKELVAA